MLETPATTGGIPDPAEAELVFGELRGRRIGWWHDAGNAARLHALGAVDAQEWLARLGARTEGLTLSDWSPSAARMPPGSGTVDWRALRSQASASMERVLRLDPIHPPALLEDALREASALGF